MARARRKPGEVCTREPRATAGAAGVDRAILVRAGVPRSSTARARFAIGVLAIAWVAGCAPPPPTASPSYPLVDAAIYDDRARELIRERGIELLPQGGLPSWWTSLAELSGNVATIPASGAAGDLQVAMGLASRNTRAAAAELFGCEPLSIESMHVACRRTDAGQIEALILSRALGPATLNVTSVPVTTPPTTPPNAEPAVTSRESSPSPQATLSADGVERPAWWSDAPLVSETQIQVCVMADGPTLREARNAALAKGSAVLASAAGKSVGAGEATRVATARLPDGGYRAFVLMNAGR